MLSNLAKNHELIELLKNGGIAVIRTDTLYGIVACAGNQKAVERIYETKGRDANKSCVVLIDSMASVYGLGSERMHKEEKYLSEVPTSFLIDGTGAPAWLLRDGSDLAYRVPRDDSLRGFLAQTGPLVAPSANPQGGLPARTIETAREYFGNAVDMYVDGGEIPQNTPPSRIIRIHTDGSKERLR